MQWSNASRNNENVQVRKTHKSNIYRKKCDRRRMNTQKSVNQCLSSETRSKSANICAPEAMDKRWDLSLKKLLPQMMTVINLTVEGWI